VKFRLGFEFESEEVGISVGFYYFLRNFCVGSDKVGISFEESLCFSLSIDTNILNLEATAQQSVLSDSKTMRFPYSRHVA
jgi:hypothetical protein